MCSHSNYWFYFKVGCNYLISTLSDYYENLSIIFYATYISLFVKYKPLNSELLLPMRVKNNNIIIPDNLNKVEQLKYRLNNSYNDKLTKLHIYDDEGDQYAVRFICKFGNDLHKLYKFYYWINWFKTILSFHLNDVITIKSNEGIMFINYKDKTITFNRDRKNYTINFIDDRIILPEFHI